MQGDDEEKEENQVDLINAAMKLNSSVSGGHSSQTMAEQFYYHIPHPSLLYADTNLRNYGVDYSQPAHSGYYE